MVIRPKTNGQRDMIVDSCDDWLLTPPPIQRALEDDRLLGKALIEYVDWSNGNGYIRLGIGEAESRRKGCGSQALMLLVQYAFCELNLIRVTAVVPAYNEGALRLFQKFGFVEETRRPRALYRDGQFWDVIGFGWLGSEWRELFL